MERYSVSQWVLVFGALIAIAGTWTSIAHVSLRLSVQKLYVRVLAQITLNELRAGKEVRWDDMYKWYEAEVPGGRLIPREAHMALAQAERMLAKGRNETAPLEKVIADTRRSIPESRNADPEFHFVAKLLIWQILLMVALLICMLSKAPSAWVAWLSTIGVLIAGIVSSFACFQTMKWAVRGRARARQLRGIRAANLDSYG
jgi:hypothetical protein